MSTSLVKFLALTDGRDKLYKIVNYGAKFCACVCANYFPGSELVPYFHNIDVVVADARRLFRFLKFVPELQKLFSLNERETLYYFGGILKAIGMALYFFFNNMSWLCGHSIITGDTQKYLRWSYRGWLLSLVVTLFVDGKRYYEIQQQQKTEKGRKQLLELKKHQKLLQFSIIRSLANMEISATYSGFHPYPSDALVGLAGVFEAALGAYQIWKAC